MKVQIKSGIRIEEGSSAQIKTNISQQSIKHINQEVDNESISSNLTSMTNVVIVQSGKKRTGLSFQPGQALQDFIPKSFLNMPLFLNGHAISLDYCPSATEIFHVGLEEESETSRKSVNHIDSYFTICSHLYKTSNSLRAVISRYFKCQ